MIDCWLVMAFAAAVEARRGQGARMSDGEMQAWLEIAADPASTPAQLAEVAAYLALIADPDYARPASGVDFLRSAGRQGPLSGVLEPHPQAALVAALVSNPNTPHPTLLHFAADFPEHFLDNPILLLLLLEHPDLFQQMNERRLLVFLRHAQIPAELLGAIGAGASDAVAEAVRLHCNSPADPGSEAAEALRMLALPTIDGQQWLIEHLALGTLPAWMSDVLQRSPEEHIQEALHNADALLDEAAPVVAAPPLTAEAFDPATITSADLATRRRAATTHDPELLRILANDDEAGVRALVAANPHVPEAVMALLEADEVQAVRAALAANPATPATLLETLARDYTWSALRIRRAVARHPNTTAATLELLASDQAIQVRNDIARNPHLTAAARAQLLERALTIAFYSGEEFFHVVAMGNPYTGAAHLAKGVRSPYWRGRYVLAQNPAAALETLRLLAEDGNRFVRAAAQQAYAERNA